MQVTITENHFATMRITSQIAKKCGIDFSEVSGSVAQPVDDFHIPWEKARSAENPITLHEVEGFSETWRLQLDSNCLHFRPAMCSLENLQNSIAARQFFD